jgi:hypothetical protein
MSALSRANEYPRVQYVLDRVARWIREGAFKGAEVHELASCDSSELTRVAADLGLTVGELRTLASHGPGAADLLPKMLKALDIDADSVSRMEPMVMRDLQRVCSGCDHKEECSEHLLAGDVPTTYAAFCPNSGTLDALKPR